MGSYFSRIGDLIKRGKERDRALGHAHALRKHHTVTRWPSVSQEESPHPGWQPGLGSPASRTGRNPFLLFKSPNQCTVLWRVEQPEPGFTITRGNKSFLVGIHRRWQQQNPTEHPDVEPSEIVSWIRQTYSNRLKYFVKNKRQIKDELKKYRGNFLVKILNSIV